MKEQSHKREMSDAVRADFERLRERGVVSTISVNDTDGAEPDVSPTEQAELEPPGASSLVSRLFRRG